MAVRTAGGDPWRITVEERAKHDNQFLQLGPQGGLITGEQAKKFFMQSGLPTPILSQIWSLADLFADGRMDRKEFSIAMCLISKTLHGFELPRTLPPSLMLDPAPSVPAMSTMSAMPPYGGMGMMGGPAGMQPRPGVQMGVMAGGRGFSMPPHMPMTSQFGGGFQPAFTNGGFGGTAATSLATGFGSAQTMPAMSSQSFNLPQMVGPTVSMAGPVPATAGGDWAVPQGSRLKYTQMFNTQDHTKKGFLSTMEGRAVLTQSNLTHKILAQVWGLSDIDSDGRLTCDEFILAMHLIDLVKAGQQLPAKLTPELIPPSYRKGQKAPAGNSVGLPPGSMGGIGSTASLPGGVGVMPGTSAAQLPPTSAPVAGAVEPNYDAVAGESSILSQVTFEDKRKENFDKGQAELDRRRQLLLDQQRQLAEERLAKERAEVEKRERKRQEMERKKQQELERQMEKQRQIEQAREEERRKALEQREAARRELERQRQLEWERQRRDQLMAEKQREQALVDQSEADVAKLRLEHEALDNKKSDMFAQIEEARSSVTNVTSQINRMRVSRDLKMSEIEKLQQDVQEWHNKLLLVQQERQQVQMMQPTDNSNVDDTLKAVQHSVNVKKQSIEKLKEQLKQIEADTAANRAKIDAQSKQHQDLQSKVDTLKEANKALSDDVISKQAAWQQKSNSSTQQNDFFKDTGDVSSVQWGSSQASNSLAWGDAFSSPSAQEDTSEVPCPGPGYRKFRGMFQFEARNIDEVTFNVGEIIWVKPDQSDAEEGWLGGLANGKEGWFPAAYAEEVVDENQTPESSTNHTPAVSEESKVDENKFEADFGAFGAQFGSRGSLTASADSSFTAVAQNAPSPTPGLGKQAPEGLQALALYRWVAKKDNHLSFEKGDVITVKEQQDMWWSGTLNGQSGWFPRSYVKVTGGSLASLKQSSPSAVDPAFGADDPSLYQNTDFTATPTDTVQTPTDATTATERALALYTYTSAESGDLTFSAGEVITITQTDEDWWTGQIGDRIGTFPANYVRILDDEGGAEANSNSAAASQRGSQANSVSHTPSQSATQTPTPSLSQDLAIPTNTSERSASTMAAFSPTEAHASHKTAKKEIAQVIAPYQATGPEQLSLQPGQLIQVRKKSPSGWWEGELQARGQKRKVGWFPANYVKLMGAGGSARSTPADQRTSASPQPGEGSRSATPVSLPAPNIAPSLEQVVALYNYAAQHDDELTFAKGSVVNVLEKSDPDWWKGELNGTSGMFPANYVAPLSEAFLGGQTAPASTS